jgi:hypothetical protein
MKNVIIIVCCLISSYFIYIYVWDNWEGITVSKHYKYYGCDIKYKHIVLSPNDISISKNIYQSDSAKCALIKCLLQRYKVENDSSLANFIYDLYKEGGFKYNYMNRINTVTNDSDEFVQPSIDTLIKYQDIIFTYRTLIEIM